MKKIRRFAWTAVLAFCAILWFSMAAFADEVLNMGSYKGIAKTRYVNDKQITCLLYTSPSPRDTR